MGVSPERVRLRPLMAEDLPLLLAWRQDSEVMRHMPSAPEAPAWEDQVATWKDSRGVAGTWRYMVLVEGDQGDPLQERPVGTTHLHMDGEVGVIIGEKQLWGQGVASAALRETLLVREVFGQDRGRPWAVIHPDNKRSRRLFEGLGFVPAGPGRNGQTKYVWAGFPG